MYILKEVLGMVFDIYICLEVRHLIDARFSIFSGGRWRCDWTTLAGRSDE